VIQRSISILKNMQHSSGLMSASHKNVKTGYNAAWLRDNVYEAMGFEAVKKHREVKKIYRALLDILLKHEYKIDHAIREKPDARHKYIHARYDPATGNEIWEEWGNKQNDAIGAILFKIGDLEEKGIKILRNHHDKRIIQKLVYYLRSIEYWHDEDSGMWEENEEIHASSVGACAAGLKKIGKVLDIEVPKWMIDRGMNTLNVLLPRESATKETDLSLLSLIYPYNIVDESQKKMILSNVENMLVRKRGVIRYTGDVYYNKTGEKGKEAEWTFGFPWLSKIYKEMKKPAKHAYYMRKTIACFNKKKELPELYYAGSRKHNENSPLGWAQAMYLVMMR